MITYPPKSPHLAGFAPPRARAPRHADAADSSGAASSGAADLSGEQAAARLVEPSPPPALAEGPGEGGNFETLVLRGASELAPYVAAWQDLADAAIEPNVFYEPWMLLPALEAFGPTPAPEFYLVFAPGRGPGSAQPRLCGLFPLVRGARYKGVRTTVLRSWRHLYCPLGTPLLRRGQEVEVLGALLDWLAAQQRGATLLELQYVSADGPFGRALVETFGPRGATTFVDECWTRAIFRPNPAGSEAYLKGAISGKRRKEFRRKEHRLADLGTLEYRELRQEIDPDAALDAFIADFLRLEASGWKGESGSAMGCDPSHREFFRAVVTQAHQRGRLILEMLRLDGHAIATKCDFLAGTGAFAFKIGFDEQYARFSPGVLLELEAIRHLHEPGSVRWMDSCAVRNHSMINRMWTERRTLQTLVIATGRGRGELIVSGLGLMRHLKRVARRNRNSKKSTSPS